MDQTLPNQNMASPANIREHQCWLAKKTTCLYARIKENSLKPFFKCLSIKFLQTSSKKAPNLHSSVDHDDSNKICIVSNKEANNHETDVDSGYAWVILATMFLINASTFGTARAYGLIFEKLARESNQSRSQAALPFTIMGAVENMAGPLTGYLLAKTQSWRIVVMLGSFLITASHLTAAMIDSMAGQIVSIGLVCGVGLSFVSISSFQINNAYFRRYRSRAFGLGLTGAAVGTVYISPLCQFILNQYDIKLCYLALGLILLPNVPLAVLLRPKACKNPQVNQQPATTNVTNETNQACSINTIFSISDKLVIKKSTSVWDNIKQVLMTPWFHLIWPTQLMFCWLNFVFGMIIVDFGHDRGLKESQVANLIPIWACGQVVGRILLGYLVDLQLVSHQLFAVISFAAIGCVTWVLNNTNTDVYEDELISTMVFILSVFISNLYLLFNGLMVQHMLSSQTGLGLGMSSFIGSFFLLPRAKIIGYYRDTFGNYDAMLSMFTYVSLATALTWLVLPIACQKVHSSWHRSKTKAVKQQQAFQNLLSVVSIDSTNIHRVVDTVEPYC